MAKIPGSLGEYAILPITLPSTTAYPVKAVHHVYVKPHSPKIPTASDSRSLFLVNVPIDSTEAHWRSAFTSLLGAGRFEGIIFENERHSKPTPVPEQQLVKGNKKRKRGEAPAVQEDLRLPETWDRPLHRSGSTAVAVLADDKSVEIALKAIRKIHKTGEYPVWGAGVKNVPAFGSARYMAHQKLTFPAEDVLQHNVDTFMGEFARREEEEARNAKRLRNVPDEDGFITVTRGGRAAPARMHDAEEARRKELEKEDEKRKAMGDFYRFQGRERRKEEQGELLKRFEEDRKRVEGMKTERRGRFRPE
jgi:ribosomal RNA-processing protein 7